MQATIQSLLYAFSSAGETLAVKALNYAPVPLFLPVYTALLSNQMWIFMVPVYLLMSGPKELPRHRTLIYALQYTGFGILTFIITILRNISVNAIPGSVFTLLISTSILFNIILSWIVLKKKFNQWHLGAALTCMASALSIGVAALLTEQEGTYNFPVGMITGIASAAAIAVMNVAQEYAQPLWDNLNLRLVEMTLVSSLVASLLIAVLGLLTGEVFEWSTALNRSGEGLVLLVCVSIILPILKLLVRNTKYSIINLTSAFFFEFIQASAALLGSLANVIIFGEPWGLGYVAALLLLAISFGMYSKAKQVAKFETKKSVTAKTISIENPIGSPQTVVVVVNVWK
jgi:drug/metabolite transporter (DMT)-like permease